MEKQMKCSKSSIIYFFVIISIMILIIAKSDIFFSDSMPIVIGFCIFSCIVLFMPKTIRKSIPMIIIEITGAIRYVLLPITMNNEYGITSYHEETVVLMLFELVAIILGIIIYCIKNRTNETDILEYKNTRYNSKVGISSIIIIIIGGAFVFSNKAYLNRYFSISTQKTIINDSAGWISLIIATFFLLIFIISLKFIKNLNIKNDLIKIGFSLIIGLFYVNGSSVTGENISRWSMLISALIVYIYVLRLYPTHKKKLTVILILTILFAVTFGSFFKFTDKKGYNSINETMKEQLKYETLNAYFTGNKNMQIALELKEDIKRQKISKLEIIKSDLFANFPILNKYLSNTEKQSAVLFNYKYYNSYIAKDQIIPYSIQVYIYFGLLFILFEIIQLYYSFKCYFMIKNRNDFLEIYCLVYLSVSFALVNCINFSIILQNIWIHVLPVFIIHIFNIKYMKNREMDVK